ncbi:MAG: PAS domain S-box protein [Thermoplasmatota archaeon]
MSRLKQKLSYLLLGQHGGNNRIKIIDSLRERPYNINQLAKKLDLNYRTVKHHIDVLMNHNILTTSGSGDYGEVYFLNNNLENNIEIFEDLKQKIDNIETSTELYQKVIEQIHNGIIIFDEDMDVIFVNKYGEEITGYSEKDLLGSKIDFFEEDDFLEKNIEKIDEGDKVYGLETEAVTKSGEQIFLRITLNKIENEEVFGYALIFEDITAQKSMQREIERNERRFKELFHESPIGIWEEDFSVVKKKIDELKEKGVEDIGQYLNDHPEFVGELMKDVKIISVNESVLDMYRADSIEEFRNGLSEIFGEKSIPSFKEVIEHIAEGKTEYKTDKVDKRLDGEEVHIFLKWSVVTGHEDDYSRVIVSTIDISELREKEEKLRKSESRLRRSQKVANVGSWEIDLETEDITWSDQTYKIFGIERGENIDYDRFLELVHPKDRDKVDKKWKKGLKDGKYDVDHRIIVDGEVKWVREKANIEFNEEGEPVDVIGSVQDITKMKNVIERIEFLNSLIDSIKDVNQELVKNDNFDDVVQKVPSILLGTKRFTNITISMFNDEGIMRPISNAGTHAVGSWEITKKGEGDSAPGCIKESLEKKGEVIVEELKPYCEKCPVSHDLQDHRTTVIPMKDEDSIIGTIRACYEPDLEIDERTLELLREVADDLVYVKRTKGT